MGPTVTVIIYQQFHIFLGFMLWCKTLNVFNTFAYIFAKTLRLYAQIHMAICFMSKITFFYMHGILVNANRRFLLLWIVSEWMEGVHKIDNLDLKIVYLTLLTNFWCVNPRYLYTNTKSKKIYTLIYAANQKVSFVKIYLKMWVCHRRSHENLSYCLYRYDISFVSKHTAVSFVFHFKPKQYEV